MFKNTTVEKELFYTKLSLSRYLGIKVNDLTELTIQNMINDTIKDADAFVLSCLTKIQILQNKLSAN